MVTPMMRQLAARRLHDRVSIIDRTRSDTVNGSGSYTVTDTVRVTCDASIRQNTAGRPAVGERYEATRQIVVWVPLTVTATAGDVVKVVRTRTSRWTGREFIVTAVDDDPQNSVGRLTCEESDDA